MLSETVADGAEVPFELAQEGSRRSPLYCYRPLTTNFLSAHCKELLRLATARAAIEELEALPTASRYLRSRGWHAGQSQSAIADAFLQAFLAHLWEHASTFTFDAERFAGVYKDVERQLYQGQAITTVLTPIEGLWVESDEVVFDDELSIVGAGQLSATPSDARCQQLPLAVVRLRDRSDEDSALTSAGVRLRRLQTVLRLWDDCEPTLGPAAWSQTDDGPWLVVALPTGIRRPSDVYLLRNCDEQELTTFYGSVAARTPRVGELAWALRRFELGCERPTAHEALTDWILAARALLDDSAEPDFELVCVRLAKLCREAHEQAHGAARLLELAALERSAIAGLARPDDAVNELVHELGAYLRAVFQGVLSGRIGPNLRELADTMDSPRVVETSF